MLRAACVGNTTFLVWHVRQLGCMVLLWVQPYLIWQPWEEKGASVMTDAIKAVVRRKFDELISARRREVLDEIFGEDIVAHDASEPEPIVGREAYRASLEEVLAAFPDGQLHIDDQLAEADKVVTRWTFTGTNEGEFFGAPPTGEEIQFSGIDIHRVEDGRIVEEWSAWDALGVMMRLRVVAEARRVV